jgi:predicted CxxxxCH...CXXCH cytochrome family protein
VIADNTSGVQTTFIPTVVGTYIFSLTVTGGSTANITVTVTNDLVGAIRTACYNCHAASGIGTSQNVFGKWSSSSHKSKGVVCSKCHVGADTGGHPGQVGSGSVSEINFNYTGATGSSNFCVTCHNPAIVTDFAASKHFIRAGSASCSYCHVGGVHNPNAACIDCHNPGNSQGLPWPPAGLEFHNTYTGTNRCTECHNQHSVVASGCDGCHGAPPATASHLKHFGGSVSQAGYGDLRIAQDFTANSTGYIIGCGNCHPMDMTKHRNGVVDIELYNPQATAGSLKARNPASAGYVTGPQIITDNKGIPYTEGTCSNVYCHSYNDWTTTAAIPADDPNWQDKVVVTRKYKSATWGGAALGCSGCHGNPTQTSYPTNDGGAGDSHAWIDSYGYGNLHTFNMAADPVSCSYCHNDTVTQKNTFTRNNMDVTVLGDVPITNFSKHVNGNNDVAFDTQKQFVYYSSSSHVSMSLAGASYAPAAKTCSNVACHMKETSVKWGTPYRVYYDACDKCHGYSGY